MGKPFYYGIRHLSPGGAWQLVRLLDERKPRLVLVEGPSDFDGLIAEIAGQSARPPIAVLAFTRESPIRTLLYPLAVYSPEYQAVLWAKRNGAECRFMDLPSGVFLGIQACREQRMGQPGAEFGPEPGLEAELEPGAGTDLEPGAETELEPGAETDLEPGAESGPGTGPETVLNPGQSLPDASAGLTSERVYSLLDQSSGEDDHETFWEHVMEHSLEPGSYEAGAAAFGKQLRELTAGRDRDWPEILVREAYMRRKIAAAAADGIPPEDIVVVTGAYHVEGLSGGAAPMTDRELKDLPFQECNVTLMPYSYYRLSSRSGYGAGNKAPSYYELLWQAHRRGDRDMASYPYLSGIAAWQREHGFTVSSAETIEAMRLARSLASLHGYETPSLRDLRDAAVTAMGHGNFSEIALAAAAVETGSVVGSLPQGVSRTSLQDDFYRNLQDLKLEKYKSDIASTLELDLRENLKVKTGKAAFRDLYRSFFLHRLRVLGVTFGKLRGVNQDNATWAEAWDIRWSPEVEIELVEAALKGDTLAQAASFAMKEQAQAAEGIREASVVIEEAFYCGMPQVVSYATEILQNLAVDSAAPEELAATGESLSVVMRFGSIRQLDGGPLGPVLSQIFLRFCLLLASACACDDQGADQVMDSMERINTLCLHHEFLDADRWTGLLARIGARDDLNTRISGFAAAILMERGLLADEELGREVHRRLSRGIPAQLGAGWFAGLSRKNRYALIARLSLWRELSGYLDDLDQEEFKRALLFLRRAFADFSSGEKLEVAENLGEIWQVGGEQAAGIICGSLKEPEQELLDSLGEFDFDDI